MNEQTLQRLEFDKLIEMTAQYAVSPAGRALAAQMRPSVNAKQVSAWLTETSEAAGLLAGGASIPLSAMEGIDPIMALLGKGKIYSEQELEQLAVWLTSIAQMKKYMRAKRKLAPVIASYAESMQECPDLREELARCIRFGALTDEASPDLAYIRRHMAAAEDKIGRRMEHALGKYRTFLQETVISKRRNRFVLAVKREHRKAVPGTVLDESASGQTLFVEPVDVADLQEELQQWKLAEERERTAVLARLSQLAERREPELQINMQAMASFDFITARAKVSRSYEGQAAKLSDRAVIRLKGARHPLLGAGCVPFDAELGLNWKQLVITGPNTGGKTITLKTIGLLALMTQSGLLIPAEPGSELGVFEHVVADVGDGQSLEQSLSTFSSHISVLKEMLACAGPRSLLLLDELAAGTDPSEGIALSISLLETLLERGALTAATTHFNEIKQFASRTPGCQNGKMAFDPDTLRPLYRLEIGEAGDSHAFAIACRFGLPESVMQRAEELLRRKHGSEAPISGIVADDKGDDGMQAGLTPSSKGSKGPDNPASRTPEGDSGPGAGQAEAPVRRSFQKGDSVWIYPLKRAGIVYVPEDELGNVTVQVKGEKLVFNRKRLKPYIPRHKLYPGEDYDLDIVFESKEHRKLRHAMKRKHVEGAQIVMPPDRPS